MKILALSKRVFEAGFLNRNLSELFNHAFISILDPDNEEKLYPETDNFLQVKMWDIDKKVVTFNYNKIYSGGSEADKGKVFELTSDTELTKIVEFCEKHKDKDFVIHCSAGISRSGAVAKYLNETYNFTREDMYFEFRQLYINNPNILPNIYIFKRLTELKNGQN